LFKYFGGDKMIEIVHSMGMKDNEPLQHPLITSALKNAQEKIEKKIVIEQNALTQSDWFKRNVK
jgi:preprotein translocase subunit SecA